MRWAFLLLSACGRVNFDPLALTNPDADPAGDAPAACLGAPACTSSSGRSVCGQVVGTGPQAGIPLRVASPTGQLCGAANIEGPCALTVTGLPMTNYFAGTLIAQVTGQIDDCGRYVVPDLDPGIADVAIVFTDLTAQPVFNTTARLVLGRPTVVGADVDVEALSVTLATRGIWANQMNPITPPETGTGYLVTYTRNSDKAPGIGVAIDNSGALMNAAGTIPWAGYFSSTFGALDSAATTTNASGTALTVLPAGPFSLEGVRTGNRCKISNLESVANTLIHVIEEGC